MNFAKQYLTWTEYQALGGALSERAFKLLEYDARKKVDERTFGRLVDLTSQVQEVKRCVYKLINVLNTENNTGIKNESADGYLITFKDKKELQAEYKSIIEEYLSNCRTDKGIPYLYPGADEC